MALEVPKDLGQRRHDRLRYSSLPYRAAMETSCFAACFHGGHGKIRESSGFVGSHPSHRNRNHHRLLDMMTESHFGLSLKQFMALETVHAETREILTPNMQLQKKLGPLTGPVKQHEALQDFKRPKTPNQCNTLLLYKACADNSDSSSAWLSCGSRSSSSQKSASTRLRQTWRAS